MKLSPIQPTDPVDQLKVMLETLEFLQYYSDLLRDVEINTAPLHLHDRKMRKQMLTLLSRPESLYVQLLLYVAKKVTLQKHFLANDNRMTLLIKKATPAEIARALWQHSNLRAKTVEPTRAQIAQATRIVKATLAFQLSEHVEPINKKEKPIQASPLLENLIEQLIDFTAWKFRVSHEDESHAHNSGYNIESTASV